MEINQLNKNIEDYVANLRTLKFDGLKFDDIFQIDGISLMWLYCRFFLAHVLPKQLNACFKGFENKKITVFEHVNMSIKMNIIKNYIALIDKFKKSDFDLRSVSQSDVLFVSFPRHIKLFDTDFSIYRVNNIFKQIKKDNKVKSNILLFPELSDHSKYFLKNLEHKGFDIIYNHISNDEIKLAKKVSLELYDKWVELDKTNIPNWNSMKYAINLYFSKQFFFITAVYFYTLKKLLIESKTKVVLLSAQNSLFERIIMALSKDIKYDVLLVPHGTGQPNPKTTHYDGHYPYYLAMGPDVKKIQIKQGYPEDRVKMVGPIVFDDFLKYRDIKEYKNKIILITQPLVEDNVMLKEDYFFKIEEILDVLADFDIVIKLHPREKHLKNYQDLIKKLNIKNAIILSGFDKNELYNNIAKSSVLIHFGSSVAQEAMLLDKFIVWYQITDEFEFIEDSPELLAKSKIELKKIIHNKYDINIISQFDKKRKKYLSNMFYKLDGKSYERCVHFIYSLICKK